MYLKNSVSENKNVQDSVEDTKYILFQINQDMAFSAGGFAMASEFMSEKDIGKYIQEKIKTAKMQGKQELVLISGDIQKELFLQDGIEEICTAMQKLMEPGDRILKHPKSQRSGGLTIQYKL